jgi:putative toxin-antitoxin system antitoxin component (TIGR02293 family)
MAHTAHAALTYNDRVIRFLGGKKTLGTSPTSTADFIQVLRAGLPYRSFQVAVESLNLSAADLSRALGLKTRTLARRRSPTGRLNPTESERMFRLARVVARAEEVLGDEAAARGWLQDPNGALGGKRPIDFLDTDVGADAVLTILGRLENGIFS